MTLHNFSSVENLMHAIRLFFILERFDIVRPVFSESSFNVFLQRYRISILMCKLITKTLYGIQVTLICKRFMLEVDLKRTLSSE